MHLNSFLAEYGLDPKETQLVRHYQRGPSGVTTYSLWRTDRPNFEVYQSVQKREVFRRRWIFTFVVTPQQQTLFSGLYEKTAVRHTALDFTCPVKQTTYPAGTLWAYTLSPSPQFSQLVGCLTVEWGAGYRSWVQRAERQNKRILEVRQQFSEPSFPGFHHLHIRLGDLAHAYTTWVAALSSTRGVYLLSFDDGQQYVGSATGERGFWQRWTDYLMTGHGGNIALRGRDARTAHVSILETAAAHVDATTIIEREMLWKQKLGSRAIALDA